jgi:hypothetical protein
VGTGRRSDPAIVHRRQSRRSRIAGTTATRAFVAVLTTLVAQIKTLTKYEEIPRPVESPV